MKSRKLIAVSAVLMLLTTAGALSVQTETTETENKVKVDIQAEDVGGIRLNHIPSEWQIDSQEDDGALTTANPDQGYVGWVWASRQSSVNTDIQFSKGDSPSADIQLTAENSDGKTIQRSISIGDQSEPGNPDEPEQPEEPEEPEDPESDGEVIFHEEFENGLNGWENIHGQNIDIRQRSGEQALWLQEGRGSQQGRDNYVRYELEESVKPDTIEFTMHQNSLCSGYCRSNEIMFKPESELEKDTRDSDRRIELDFKRRTVNQQYDGVQTIVGPLDGDELFENPFQGEWTTFRLEMDWEKNRIGALYVDGEKKLEDVEVQGEVSRIKAIDINRGFYSSEPLWVDEIKLYNGDGTETEDDDTDNTGQELEILKDFSEGMGDWSVGKEFMGDRSMDSDSSGTYSENYGGSVKVNVEGAPGGMDVYKEVDQPIPEGAEIKAYYKPSEGSWSAGGPALKLRYPDSVNVKLENENERTEKDGVLKGEVPKRLPKGGAVHLDSNVWPGSYTVYFTEIKASELGSDQGEPDEPKDPIDPVEPKQGSISFEDGAFSSISSNGPLKIVEGEAKTSGKNGYEVSQKYSTKGQNSLHLASYGSLDPIKVGFKADLTNVEKLVYDGYPEANNAINGDIYLYAGSNQISNDLVFYPMGEPAPEEDVWHEDIEEDISDIKGEKMVSFRVRGSGNDAYFDNIRFLNSEGERISPEDVLVSDSQTAPPENPVEDPDDGNRTICVGQCNPQGDLISDKEAESAMNTLNQIETRLKELEKNVVLMVDYYDSRDSEKAKAWTEIQIKISAAQRKIETTKSKLQNAEDGKEISSSEIKDDLDSIQTGIKTATELILEA